jgi:hypothetical protein
VAFLTAISTGDAILIIIFTTIPIAALTFALGARGALDQIGKGQFSVEFESDLGQKAGGEGEGGVSSAVREAEIRQLLEAKAYRQGARGEAPLDVDSELNRLLAEGTGGGLGHDAQLREEVRQLVVARNERRIRQGKEPLDVDEEVERQLRELENLGQ